MPQLKPRTVSESAIHDQTAVVFPNDLNAVGVLFGGRVLEMADLLAGVVAHRHAGRECVTLGLDSVRFLAPARRGDILVLQAAVNRAWTTSMEIGVKVSVEDYRTLERRHIFSAYFTFVAVDETGRPTAVPPLLAEAEEEVRRYRQADHRRRHRMEPHDWR